MGMTVKELITRLLEEDMNEEVCLQTTDSKHVDETNKKGHVLFHISSIEHWNGMPLINFTDWRVDNGNDD